MNLPKTILIGGIATVIVATDIESYLTHDNSANQDNWEIGLLADYQNYLEEIKDAKMKTSLSENCNNPQKFSEQIQALETRLDILNKRKNNLLTTTTETTKEEWIPPIPGSEPPDLMPMPEIDTTNSELLNKINVLEEEILKELNNLKSICDEEKKPEIISSSCEDACKKYSDCTRYTEGSTKEDQNDAYDSCMIECANRSDKTKNCINKKPITSVNDCTNLSICALAEYSNALK